MARAQRCMVFLQQNVRPHLYGSTSSAHLFTNKSFEVVCKEAGHLPHVFLYTGGARTNDETNSGQDRPSRQHVSFYTQKLHLWLLRNGRIYSVEVRKNLKGETMAKRSIRPTIRPYPLPERLMPFYSCCSLFKFHNPVITLTNRCTCYSCP